MLGMNKVVRTNKNWLQDYDKKLQTLANKEVAIGYPTSKGLDTPYYASTHRKGGKTVRRAHKVTAGSGKRGISVIQAAIWNN